MSTRSLVPNVSFGSLYGLVSSPLRPSTPNGDAPQTRPLGNKPLSQASTSDPDEDEHVPLIRRASHETVKEHDQHNFHHKSDSDDVQPLIRRAPALVQEAELQLSAECPHCSSQVVIKVPRYMMEVIGNGKARMGQELLAASSRGADIDFHGHQQHWNQPPPETTRDRVVRYSVRAATAFRQSRVSSVTSLRSGRWLILIDHVQLPALILAFVRTTIAVILYLDERFSIHQRLIVVFWIVLADLQRIEQEVGLLRNSGDAISVMWEAFVKGAIALAKPAPSTGHEQYTVPGPRPGAPLPPSSARSDMLSPNQQGYPFPANNYRDAASYGYTDSPPLRATHAAPQLSRPPSLQYLHPPHGANPAHGDDYHNSSAGESSSDHEYLEAPGSNYNGARQNSGPGSRSTSATRRRTLRRMANSVPSFHNDGSSTRSGSLTPGADQGLSTGNDYFESRDSTSSDVRPHLGRRRSRSGPENPAGVNVGAGEHQHAVGNGELYGSWNERRGWVASKVAGVVGRVI